MRIKDGFSKENWVCWVTLTESENLFSQFGFYEELEKSDEDVGCVPVSPELSLSYQLLLDARAYVEVERDTRVISAATGVPAAGLSSLKKSLFKPEPLHSFLNYKHILCLLFLSIASYFLATCTKQPRVNLIEEIKKKSIWSKCYASAKLSSLSGWVWVILIVIIVGVGWLIVLRRIYAANSP